MIRLMDRRWIGIIVVIAAGWASGCSAPTPTAAPTEAQLPVETRIPGIGSDEIALQTLVPASALNELEQAAAASGVLTYTGYTCVIAPVGCACETPVLQDASFTFTPDNHLIYDFTPRGGSPAQWQLDHAGLNQWSYTTGVATETGETAILLALLTFTESGYDVTQVATYPTGDVSKCDIVNFHRLDTGAPQPTPAS